MVLQNPSQKLKILQKISIKEPDATAATAEGDIQMEYS
jgi:hypothetical protein